MRIEAGNREREWKVKLNARKMIFTPESVTGCMKEKMEGKREKKRKEEQRHRQGNQVLETVLPRVATMSQSKLDPMT